MLLALGALGIPGGIAAEEGGLPTDDRATFFLGEAAAAPGQTDVSLPLSINVKPDSPPVLLREILVAYDPAVLGNVRLETTREGGFRGLTQEEIIEPGVVGLVMFWGVPVENWGTEPLTSLNDGVVAELRFCVLESAAPGVYPIEFVRMAHGFPNGQDLHTWFAMGEGGHYVPLLEPGRLTIAGDPRTDGACGPEPVFKATYQLGDATASPGSQVAIPFSINAKRDARGFSFSVDFDEEVLEATAIEKVFRLPDGTTDYAFQVLRINNSNQTPGNSGIDEGFLVGSVIYSLVGPEINLPARTDNEVLSFHFLVNDAAPIDTTTEVRFLDGALPPGAGAGLRNVVSINGVSILPGTDAAYVYLPGRISIVGDVSIFIRGDSNDDLAVDLSDAQATLSHLFLGGGPLRCSDAADANDDGKLDITDAVYLLSFLFLGAEERIPPPYPAPGNDSTPDLLGCRQITG
jgi:hypothetical protein